MSAIEGSLQRGVTIVRRVDAYFVLRFLVDGRGSDVVQFISLGTHMYYIIMHKIHIGFTLELGQLCMHFVCCHR